MTLRVSDSIRIGPIRIRLSASKNGLRLTEGTRIGRRGWASLSQPLGGKRRRR